MDDRQLMAQLCAGSDEAFGELYSRHRERVYAVCLQISARPDDAADLTQETFLRVLRYRESFRGDAKFTTWIYRIARNVCVDGVRRRRRHDELHAELDERVPAAATEEDAMAEHDLDRLDRALHRLPLQSREPLVLVRYHGMSYREVGEILACTPGAARVRVHRALQALREIYQHLELSDAM